MADLEHNQPLLQAHRQSPSLDPPATRDKPNRPPIAALLVSCILLLSLVSLILLRGVHPPVEVESLRAEETVAPAAAEPRGRKEGVSEKGFRATSGESGDCPWTNVMLQWQRTGYHFQPQKNWMNDPDGPLYHLGYYHLFYQYNPDSAVWGNITWGHAVSTDLIHWKYLPLSMVPDHWYDINGAWTGSATILPDGKIMMLYTGDTDDYVQVQNLAYPANLSDPLLLDWVKYPGNPVMTPPEGIGSKNFRDPSTAWVGHDGVWRLTIGSMINKTGISLVYQTTNFTTIELVDILHKVPGTGMWECVDFYPVSTTGENGLDTSAYGPGIKHLLKASLDDEKVDYYALGTYNITTEKWVPDNPEFDVGIGLRVDYGRYYASKSFFDPVKSRRILWGWVDESDTEAADLAKGWASVQTIPRVVTFDKKTKTNVLQWPVVELEELRTENATSLDVILKTGSIVNLNLTNASQLDIVAEFSVDSNSLKTTVGDDVINNCTEAAVRQALGPFGVVVLADESLSELTPVYFHIAKASDGTVRKWFCTDLSRSTLASGVDKKVHGGPVPVLDDENYNMRILVDHSIVESFAQGGRTCTTTRIYPTKAINGAARLFLFNNATDLNVTASVKIWRIKSAEIGPFY